MFNERRFRAQDKDSLDEESMQNNNQYTDAEINENYDFLYDEEY